MAPAPVRRGAFRASGWVAYTRRASRGFAARYRRYATGRLCGTPLASPESAIHTFRAR